MAGDAAEGLPPGALCARGDECRHVLEPHVGQGAASGACEATCISMDNMNPKSNTGGKPGQTSHFVMKTTRGTRHLALLRWLWVVIDTMIDNSCDTCRIDCRQRTRRWSTTAVPTTRVTMCRC